MYHCICIPQAPSTNLQPSKSPCHCADLQFLQGLLQVRRYVMRALISLLKGWEIGKWGKNPIPFHTFRYEPMEKNNVKYGKYCENLVMIFC